MTRQMDEIDSKLSKRHIPLDPAGYFLIYVNREEQLIYASHYSIAVNERGLAVDPNTGKPLPAKGKVDNQLIQVFKGRTAKELCVEIFERSPDGIVTHLNHAAYLGREFQRAELALRQGTEYVQD